jgi:hypothetical protein
MYHPIVEYAPTCGAAAWRPFPRGNRPVATCGACSCSRESRGELTRFSSGPPELASADLDNKTVTRHVGHTLAHMPGITASAAENLNTYQKSNCNPLIPSVPIAPCKALHAWRQSNGAKTFDISADRGHPTHAALLAACRIRFSPSSW